MERRKTAHANKRGKKVRRMDLRGFGRNAGRDNSSTVELDLGFSEVDRLAENCHMQWGEREKSPGGPTGLWGGDPKPKVAYLGRVGKWSSSGRRKYVAHELGR